MFAHQEKGRPLLGMYWDFWDMYRCSTSLVLGK